MTQSYPVKEKANHTSSMDQEEKSQSKQKHWIFRYGEGIAALTSGLLLVIAVILEKNYISSFPIFYILAFVIGGFASAREGLTTLIKDRDLDVNFLMIFAAIGAAWIGYWTEGAILIFIFSLSGALESFTIERSYRDISSLMDLKPEKALLFRDGEEVLVDIEDLQIGNHVIVKPGERIPTDGRIIEGTSAIDQASITGESIPVDKIVGDEVFAGTLNGQGALLVEVTETSESSLFSKIIRLVQEAQSEMPASQLFIERFERIYARTIVVATILLILIPYYLLHWSWNDSIYKAMVFLVVASPCALVASIMPAMLSAISNSARKGLLFKGGAHLENISRTKVVALDKTGTLTVGKPTVTDVITFNGYTEEEVLQLTASIEMLSEHPIAQAIVAKAVAEQLTLERPRELQALTGWGVQAEYMGELWKIGKPSFMETTLLSSEHSEVIHKLENQGKTVIAIQNSKEIVGVIALQDQIRPEAKRAIKQLKRMGIKVAMLTGDQRGTAQTIATEAGIDLVYAELLPQDKVDLVKQLRDEYGHIVMVGDGVNDAPALATATVGIAMGGTGSDVALETADLVLMNDDIEKIAGAVSLGKRSTRIVKQNVIFSLSVIAILIIANFSTGISLPLGVIGHEGSTILVILNGLRLLR